MIGLVGATLTVAATTLDDAVWLVPYVTSLSLPFRTRIIHALLFIATLESLTFACVVVSTGISSAVVNANGYHAGDEDKDRAKKEGILLGAVGAMLCWIMAGVIYLKKLFKRRRKRLAAAAAAAETRVDVRSNDCTYGAIHIAGETMLHADNGEDIDNADVADDASSSSSSSSGSSSAEKREIPTHPSPWAVISFTTLGALDEISYFPALLVGKVFTPTEMCTGTFFASILILVTVTFFLAKFKPLVDWLDSIPLYGIIAMFAFLLTVSVIVDIWN